MAVQARRKAPPASRATTPPATGGRHRAAPRSVPRRLATGAVSTARHDVVPAARGAYRAGNRAAAFTTQRKGGQHALMAEFLLFAGIVGLRAVADYVPAGQGTASEGTGKGSITPREGQLGPLPVLAAGFVVFFVLSFMAARGGAWARVAAVSGLIIDTALLMKSLPELGKVSQAFGTVQAQTIPSATPGIEVLPTPGGSVNPQTDPGIYTQLPGTSGFPAITPNIPPAAAGAGFSPVTYTQPQP
jgi:hypothetical protein